MCGILLILPRAQGECGVRLRRGSETEGNWKQKDIIITIIVP